MLGLKVLCYELALLGGAFFRFTIPPLSNYYKAKNPQNPYMYWISTCDPYLRTTTRTCMMEVVSPD